MTTITITISVMDEPQKPLTIKSTIQEQIEFHLKEQKNAIEIEKQLETEIKEKLKEIADALNAKVGEDIWVMSEKNSWRTYPEIQFGKKNAVKLTYDTKKTVFGNIVYVKPKPESIRMVFVDYSIGYGKTVESLDQIHELADAEYVSYFTKKLQ